MTNFSIARLFVFIACSMVVIPPWKAFLSTPWIGGFPIFVLAFAISGAIVGAGLGGLLRTASQGALVGLFASGGAAVVVIVLPWSGLF